MTQTIWKYEIPVTDEYHLAMPKGAQILHVAPSHVNPTGAIWLWARVEEPTMDEATEVRVFLVYGTGHEIRPPSGTRVYIGTVTPYPLVWHVFELVSDA